MRKLILVLAVATSASVAFVQHALAAPKKPRLDCSYSSEQAVKDMYQDCKPSCDLEKDKTGCLAACVRIRDTCLRKMENDKAAERARKAAAEQKARDDQAAKQAKDDEKKDVKVHPSLVCQETPVECMMKCHNSIHDDEKCADKCGGDTAKQKFKKCIVR